MGPTALLPLRRKSCYGFLLPLKIHCFRPGLNPWTFGLITWRWCELLERKQWFRLFRPGSPYKSGLFISLYNDLHMTMHNVCCVVAAVSCRGCCSAVWWLAPSSSSWSQRFACTLSSRLASAVALPAWRARLSSLPGRIQVRLLAAVLEESSVGLTALEYVKTKYEWYFRFSRRRVWRRQTAFWDIA
jgi:hypothetical protein